MLVFRRDVMAGLAAILSLGLAGHTGSPLAQEDDVRVTALFNDIRRQNGLGNMSIEKKLQQAAHLQANLMARHEKLAHAVSRGNGFKARLRKAGIRGAAAENIAAGQPDPRAVFTAWLNSFNHRRNMLNPAFTHYGLASAANPNRPGYLYWALVLGR